jgi:hypothetical protein
VIDERLKVIVHNARSSLTCLIGNMELLQEGKMDPEEVPEAIADCLMAARKLHALVEEIAAMPPRSLPVVEADIESPYQAQTRLGEEALAAAQVPTPTGEPK